jgi:hypothetical protein
MNQLIFLTIQKTLPNEPGIYKYFDSGKNLLYIGKAKNIRKRVSSYFTKNNQSFKTHELVKQIDKIEFTIVNTEHDALLLENALIKEFRPKYNIELKDDKTYPYIVIKNEPFPRVFLTRRKINDGSNYLGPFTSIKKLRELLSFIKLNIMKLVNYFLYYICGLPSKDSTNGSRIFSHGVVSNIKINSRLVSAQNRPRLYWTNIPNITQPKDLGLNICDVISPEFKDKYPNYLDLPFYGRGTRKDVVKSYKGKASCLTASMYKGQISSFCKNELGQIYKYTPQDCELFQTLPLNYTRGVSNTERFKLLGNGWTVDVITHIFKNMK